MKKISQIKVYFISSNYAKPIIFIILMASIKIKSLPKANFLKHNNKKI